MFPKLSMWQVLAGHASFRLWPSRWHSSGNWQSIIGSLTRSSASLSAKPATFLAGDMPGLRVVSLLPSATEIVALVAAECDGALLPSVCNILMLAWEGQGGWLPLRVLAAARRGRGQHEPLCSWLNFFLTDWAELRYCVSLHFAV